MWLEKIALLNYKNYPEAAIQFSEYINCFVGENGSGKTNLLDAIYYLSFTKSAFSSTEQQNMRHGASLFLVKGTFCKHEQEYQVQFSLQTGQKKDARNSRVPYEKLSEHIGLFPAVLISPDDTDLIRERSENRRRFFDSIISQINHAYLDDLIRYNHLLLQRNRLLKQFAERRTYDGDLLDAYSEPLLTLGRTIYEARQAFIAQFAPLFEKHYRYLSDDQESVAIHYQSHFAQPAWKENFYRAQQRDQMLQRTTQGTHRDDFVFEIGGYPVKKYGSQGQQKSFVIALKLAQFEIIHQETGVKPLLLLDDIFDKLDDHRIAQLTRLVVDQTFGQLFVTDARPERTRQLFQEIEVEKKFFVIRGGEVAEELVEGLDG
ncbi:MAG: DNA replication/repair protein RecF [Tunicatimonas sp.]